MHRGQYRLRRPLDDAIITRVMLQLKPGDSREIHERIRKNNDWRTSTQPIREKSAGCIFKNPGDSSAGKLIEDSGLKAIFSWRGNGF